jgi:hypothetical protein
MLLKFTKKGEAPFANSVIDDLLYFLLARVLARARNIR